MLSLFLCKYALLSSLSSLSSLYFQGKRIALEMYLSIDLQVCLKKVRNIFAEMIHSWAVESCLDMKHFLRTFKLYSFPSIYSYKKLMLKLLIHSDH